MPAPVGVSFESGSFAHGIRKEAPRNRRVELRLKHDNLHTVRIGASSTSCKHDSGPIMTLTSILPTLRRTLPDPLRVTAWPEHTQATTTDVVIAGISMLRLVELCDTPCVHTADALIPGAHQRPALQPDAAVIIARVTAVLKNPDAERVILIDACLDTVPAVWEEARLIGRVSTATDAHAIILAGESHLAPCDGRNLVELPTDLREGDLLVIPCTGMVSLHDVRPQPTSTDNTASSELIGATGFLVRNLE